MTLVLILALFVFLVAATLFALRLPPTLAVLFWLAIPLVLTPVWLSHSSEQWTWFLWAKIWSVSLACAWAGLCYAWPRISARGAGLVVLAFLTINIAEAATWDLVTKNGLNAVAGILLIVALLVFADRATISRPAGTNIVGFDLSWVWILGFTLWDSCFLYMYWDGLHFGRHLAVLGAPLVVALILGRRAWLHARAVSLGAYLLMYGTFQDAFIAHIDTTAWQHPAVRTPFAVASLGLALLACMEALRRRRRTAEAESPARQAIP